MSPLAEALAASPELFPAALDINSGAVTLWHLTEADYGQESFLDGRIAAGRAARPIAFSELAQAIEDARLPESCDFIFHIGHVGSTLLSRLLGKHAALFCLREPDILRMLAACPNNLRAHYLPVFLKLWSRCFDPAAHAVLKTTSFVGEIAVELLSRPYKPRALAMGVPPEIYLATIFGGANAPAEAYALAPFRLSRLNCRLGTNWHLADLGAGEIVAMGWVCETLCLAEAARIAEGRVLVLDFDTFFGNSHQTLRAAFSHFDVHPTESEISEILAGAEMRSYSKAPEHPYDAQMRRAVLAEGRVHRASEIRQGLRWLERGAGEHSAIANTLSLFKPA